MNNKAQNRAIRNYRKRLRKRGVGRFEVLGLDRDRDLIRSLARRLAQNDAGANRIRGEVLQTVAEVRKKTGGIFQALRRSPLVGAELAIERPFDTGRKVAL